MQIGYLLDGNKITVKVTTSADVEGVSVNGTLLTSYSTNSKGNRIWTAKVSTASETSKVIDVIAYNAEGTASAPVSTTVTITPVNSLGTAIGSVINTLLGWLFN